MIPRTFLSTYASNGQQQMAVVFLTDITGLKRWADYIPVKLSQGGSENSYANDGYVDVVSVVKTSTMRPFAEYVPVYVDNSASDAWQVNATGYIPYGYAGFGDASMFMDFTNGAALDPRITFTRASTATYFNSSGVLTTTGFNLLLQSQDFTTSWSSAGLTTTANTISAPDGTTTGDTITEDSATSAHNNIQSITAIIGNQYTFSVFAKGNGRDIQLCFGSSDVTGDPYANFDLSSGTVGTTGGTITAVISNAGNSWYRCSVTVTSAVTSSFGCIVALTNSTSATRLPSYTGNNSSGAYLWGAQLETGSTATTYIPTTSSTSGAARFDYNPTTLAPLGLLIEESRTNLFTYSEQFDNAAWTKTNSTITANAIVSPDGTMDGDKHIPNNGVTIGTGASETRVYQSPSVTSGTSYTYSMYAKAGEYDQLALAFITSPSVSALFSLTLGTIVSGTGATITSVGNGWYRCSLTTAATSTGTLQMRWSAESSTVSTGDGTSGIYIWGAQFEAGAFATSYIPTVASQVTRASDLATMTGTNFSSWYNATEGTVYFESQTAQGTSSYPYSLFGTSTSNRIFANYSSSLRMNSGIRVGGTFDVSVNTPNGSAPLSTFGRGATAYKVNDFGFSWNGAAALTDTSTTLPTVQQLDIGNNGGLATNFLNGTIKKIAYFNRRLTDAELQGITA